MAVETPQANTSVPVATAAKPIAATPAVAAPAKDPKSMKEKLGVIFAWLFFGGTFLAVMGRLLMEIATGR